MDLTQLELFKAVAEEGSITAAAAKVHRVPSNLTTRIKQLESELGVDLFIREKLRLRLSANGYSFLDYTRRILDLVEEARLAVSSGEPQGVFTLGSLESTAAVRIPPLLAAYHQALSQGGAGPVHGAFGRHDRRRAGRAFRRRVRRRPAATRCWMASPCLKKKCCW